MVDETIVGLVRDLTSHLSAIADEFGTRADQLGAGSGTSGQAADPRRLAELILMQRRVRADFFPAELFHEPAWDMLLALYVGDSDGGAMNVKTLVAITNAPATTSQRWIDHLHKQGLVDRTIDPADRRRIDIALSETGRGAIDRYLARIANA